MTKPKNVVAQIDDSENESVSSISDSEVDENKKVNSDNESVVSSDEEIQVEKETKPKKVPVKKAQPKKTKAKKSAESDDSDDETETKEEFSLEKLFETYEKKLKEFNDIDKTLGELQTQVKDVTKKFKTCYRELKKATQVLQVTLIKEHKKLNKSKRKKTTGRKEGGFNKTIPVPLKICKYVGIPVDSSKKRSEITKLLYAEFKTRGLNQGDRKYKMDKETAQLFGRKKGTEFHIHEFQGMLKEIYDGEKTTESL